MGQFKFVITTKVDDVVTVASVYDPSDKRMIRIMDQLSTFEWVSVFLLAVGGSITLNYESMARKHGFPIGTQFMGITKNHMFAFASVAVSVIYSFSYGEWWYALVVFFAGMSIGTGLLILMFKAAAQPISLIAMAVGAVMTLVSFLERPPIVL